MFGQMPKVVEIGRLQRLKQAVLGAARASVHV